MARDNQRINDQIFRTRSRNAAEERAASEENHRRRQIRSWIILVTIVVAVLLGIRKGNHHQPASVLFQPECDTIPGRCDLL